MTYSLGYKQSLGFLCIAYVCGETGGGELIFSLDGLSHLDI